jgi:hypothetical protein
MTLCVAASVATVLAPPAKAQLWTWTKDQMVEYTKAWTGDRFPDGRPKVPDQWLERAKDMSQEEITIPGGGRGGGGGGFSQYEGDWRVLHPKLKMAGRAVTMAFMPARADLDQVVMAKAKEKGIPPLHNRYGFDMLQPGDVMVVDLCGMKEGGAIGGISPMLMPCCYRPVHPTWITGVTLSAVDVPVRIGNVTMMSGDMYGSPRDPALRQYSQERLVEIKASRKK